MAAGRSSSVGGFLTGVLSGAMVSVFIIILTALAFPIVETAENTRNMPERLSGAVSPTTVGPIDTQSAAQPVVTTPATPGRTPAVDPDIPRDDIVLGEVSPLPQYADAPALNTDGADAPQSRSAVPVAPQPAASVNTSDEDLSGTDNPERVAIGAASPASGLGAGSADIEESALPVRPALSETRPGSAQAPLMRPQAPGLAPVPNALGLGDETEVATVSPDAVAPSDLSGPPRGERPFDKYAVDFTVSGDQPLISLLLVDAGVDGIDIAALSGLLFPVTFAIPVDAPDSTERAAAYRAAGFEIVAMLPEGEAGQLSGFSEAEMQLRYISALTQVPEAIGLLDRLEGDIALDTNVAQNFVSFASQTGHALISHRSQGFNTVDAVSAAAGVPSASVFQVIEGSSDIPQVLSRAAVQASGTGGVVVVGRTNGETITGLFSWFLGSGSTRTVDLAPLSALIDTLER